MNWAVLTLIAVGCKTIQNIHIRIATKEKISTDAVMLAIFPITTIACFIITAINGNNFLISGKPLLAVIVSALVGSYLGSVAEIKGTEHAPNPGYALSLCNTSALFATLGSFFFFNDPLTPQRFAGIIVIIISTFFVMYQKNRAHTSSFAWALYGVQAALCYGALILLSRYAFDRGYESPIVLGYICAVVSLMTAIKVSAKRTPLQNLTMKPHRWIMIGLASIVFNVLLYEAFLRAPNAGYASALSSVSGTTVCIIAVLFFKDHISLPKLAGVLGVVAGVALLLI